MAEQYNYQLVTGIVKVVRPNNKPVVGIADGQGMFLWLPTDKIIVSHPNQFVNWQTTIFAVDPSYQVNWKPEQKWEQYKDSYPSNTKPIPQPIPQMFLQARISAPIPQPIQQVTNTQPLNSPPPTSTFPVQNINQIPMPQQPALQIPSSSSIQVSPVAATLERIALTLESMERLLRIYINPPKFVQADSMMTEEDILSEYGAPPEEELEVNSDDNVNKEDLPSIF